MATDEEPLISTPTIERTMLKVWLSLARPPKLYRLMEIQQTGNQILILPHTSFGFHLTIHDVTDSRPYGLVHSRINPRQGAVRELPGERQVSDERGVALERRIPAFRDIKGVVDPFSPSGTTFSLIKVDQLIGQSSELTSKDVRKAALIAANPPGSATGFHVLLVQPENLASLQRWLSDAESLGKRFPSKITVSSAHVFTAFVPWLAVTVESGE